MKFRISTFVLLTVCTAGLLMVIACNDMLEIQSPADEITTDPAFEEPSAIEDFVNGMYKSDGYAFAAMFWKIDMTADDFTFSSLPDNLSYLMTNTYEAEDNEPGFWNPAYPIIFTANTLLKRLPENDVLSEQIRRQYLAEARFMRAYCYFYLVNLYGDVPLVQSTNVDVNIEMPRTSAGEVWSAIFDDLEQALDMAPANFDDPGRANQWAIRSLLARAHLYRGNWSQAETMATEVISDGPFSLETDLTQVFVPDSPEAIFVPPLGSTSSFTNRKVIQFASNYLPSLLGPPRSIFRDAILDDFEPGDNRLDEWAGTDGDFQHPYKYINTLTGDPVRKEQLIHIRLAELYLIRAEARAQQGNVSGPSSAETDINEVRSRAGLSGTTASTQTDMLDAVMTERRVELFAEGQRWFDLKRTGRIDDVLGELKDAWESYKKLFPVPLEQMNAAPQYEQNSGW